LLEENEIPVKKLLRTKYSRIITYPLSDEAQARAIIKELVSVGVTALVLEGSTLIDGIPILGKGCVGLVVRAFLDEEPVALKIRRADADRASMENEARLLRLANSVGVGPKLNTATRNLLAMGFFDGMPLFKWVQRPEAGNASIVKRVMRRLVQDCFKLDSVGLDHGELSHAPKNVLVNRASIPCIVDFESGSMTRRVANVTSLLQYFLFGKLSRLIGASKLFPNRKIVLKSLSLYKQECSVESFQNVLGALGL